MAVVAVVAVLVADAGLGAINAVRLCVAAVERPTVVVLNRYDSSELHARNRRWLEGDVLDDDVDPAEVAARLVRTPLERRPGG